VISEYSSTIDSVSAAETTFQQHRMIIYQQAIDHENTKEAAARQIERERLLIVCFVLS
jgi:hypothetical protein